MSPDDTVAQIAEEFRRSDSLLDISGADSGSDVVRLARYLADSWTATISPGDNRRITIPREAEDYNLVSGVRGDLIVIAAMPHCIELWNVADWNAEQSRTASELNALSRAIGI